MAKKFNLSLFIACLLGGIVGYYLAENFYNHCNDSWNPVPLVGIYFAIVVFCISLFGVITEYQTNHISAKAWDGATVIRTLGLLFALTVGGFLLVGMLLQFIYGLGKVEQISYDASDYIVMIDNSGSTSDTDVNEERFSSVVEFVKNMDNSQRIMISIFDDFNTIVLPLTQKNDGLDQKVQQILSNYDSANNTDIQRALFESLDNYSADGKQAIAMLFSDGESEVDIPTIIDRYIDASIPIFTVGFSERSFYGKRLLEKIANKTGGAYYEINGSNSFTKTYGKIINYKAKRILLDYRIANEQGKIIFMIIRTLSIMILVFLLGPALGFILDSEELLLKNIPLRCIAGLFAGLILEFGMLNYSSDVLLRFILCILMSLVISIYAPTKYGTTQITGYEVYTANNKNSQFTSSLSDATRKNKKHGHGTELNINSPTHSDTTKEFTLGDRSSKRNDKNKPTFK